jgi:hypothetical protein
VFPDDLSGMPPERDIEFKIEMQPDTTLIGRTEDLSHPVLRPKPDVHHMYAQDQVVIHTNRM